MVAMPTCNFGDLLVADGTESSLFFPEGKQPVFPFEGRCHVNVKTFFKIAFPCRVIRVGFPLNFDVSYDRHVCCADEVTCVFLHCADRKSTRLNSSHANTSYAVFCLKQK